MFDKNNIIKAFAVFLGLLFLSQPALVYADWGRESHHRHYHYSVHNHYPPYGRAVVILPSKYISIVIGGSRYYHCDGVFYRRERNDYVVVAPPSGVIVEALPADYQQVRIDGATYFESKSVYYKYIPGGGYEVVSQPRVTVIEAAKISPDAQLNNADEIYTVNIPNAQGKYTAVVLKRSGDGFVGPQGEYYSDFPKIEQLKLMYGK